MASEDLEIVEQGEVPDLEPQAEPVNDMLPKSTVSKIVERERLKAYEKGKQEVLMQLQQDQQQPQPVQPELAPAQQAPQAPQQPGQSLGGMPQMGQADIERMIAEKLPHHLQDHVNHLKNEHMINSFVQKMQAAESRHPGLESRLNDLDYSPTMTKVIEMANNMENTADVMKELLDNPTKLFDMLNAVREQPRLAQSQIAALSNSIKQNQEALAQEKQAQDPMSQLRPSSSAGIDNSTMSVKDFRNMFRA